jgi:hypothetical protein
MLRSEAATEDTTKTITRIRTTGVFSHKFNSFAEKNIVQELNGNGRKAGSVYGHSPHCESWIGDYPMGVEE